MKQGLVLLLVCTFFPVNAHGAVHTQKISYAQGQTPLEGYLAYDDAIKGKKPGVLIVHDWSGLGSHFKTIAEQLAGLGYAALAVDMYGKDIKPGSHDFEMQAELVKTDHGVARARITVAFETLNKQPQVDPSRIAAIGYCVGAVPVLELARSGADVKGSVAFHGLVNTSPDEAKNIKGKFLILHGDRDPYVPQRLVNAFDEELTQAGVGHEVHWFKGAVHSFTIPGAGADNPHGGSVYNADADHQSWEDMKKFFDEIFKTHP